MRAIGRGNRNLMLLGVGALLLTFATTAMSLWIYRSSGDIYLDRSRPGYLPDKEEANEETGVNNNFTFSDTGALTQNELREYLDELKKLNDRLKALPDPYAPDPLSDQSLGISSAKPEATPEAKK